ncbi:hypothetical protein ACFE04_004802 [Oxalis oulophora]
MEAAPDPNAPRFAPDDPTLPKPWRGLIDGSTGVLYYWNPDTNLTQYEKPQPPPPLAAAAPTPKLAPLPTLHSVQQNGPLGQHHQGQESNSIPHQHGFTEQQQGSQHWNPSMQQQGQFTAVNVKSQIMQHPTQTHVGDQMPQQGQNLSQQPVHHGPQQYGQPMQQQQKQQQQIQPQGHQFMQQQMPYLGYQQTGYPPPQAQQQFPTQQPTFPKREDAGNNAGISATGQYPQFSSPPSQNMSSGNNPIQMPHSTANLQSQRSSLSTQPHTGTDLVHQQRGPEFHHQSGMHGQQTNAPSVGMKRPYEDNVLARTGNDHYHNPINEPAMMGSQRPKLAALPVARNHQEVRNAMPGQNPMPGHSDGFAVHNAYNHAGQPYPTNPMMRPPYSGPSDISNISSVEAYCLEHEVSATGDNVPAPFMSFDAVGFPPEILREVRYLLQRRANVLFTAGFKSPTPIQAQTWPIALQSRDIVAIAKTGSGKTLGYLIPAFMLLRQRRNNPQNGPTVLVLSPTRELATQIQDEAIKFGRSSRVSCTCLYGGAPKGPQLKELERGADIVVATPGRLNDILEMRKIDLRQVSLIVLDEADRMLDMGFEPQIRKVVNEIPPRRQTLMYTATWPKEVKKIASDLLVNPVQVNIGSDQLAANKAITQYVEVVPPFEKERRLEQILGTQERGSKVIIFCSTKRLCDQIARSLGRNFGALAIHGDKSQGERDWVLNQFRNGKSPVLVATDVAARGLDIKDIRVVINYDFPTGVEDYVHRIGRTGRAGATGIAYTFFSEQDWKYAPDLVKLLEGANQQVPPQVREIALRGGFGGRGGMNRFDSGGGRWDSGGRGGMRDGGFGGRGGMRDGGFGGRGGGMRDNGFGGRGGGMRDNGFGGRGGEFGGGRGGMRDGGFGGGRGGRSDFVPGRGGNRGRGFSSPGGGGRSGWGRNESDRGGRGRGRAGRYDNKPHEQKAPRRSGFDVPPPECALPPPITDPAIQPAEPMPLPDQSVTES